MEKAIRIHFLIFCLAPLMLVGLSIRPVYGNGTEEPCKRGKYCLNGVFIQPDNHIAGWPEEKWLREFQRMRNLGFKKLIVQWCRYDDIEYYSTTHEHLDMENREKTVQRKHIINTIIRLSRVFEMDLYLGLYHDSSYWSQIKASPDVVENYLYHLIDRNLKVAEALLPLISKFSGFKGFYIPQEVDDVTWFRQGKAKNLRHFIVSLNSRLKQLHPGCKVLMSTFFRGRTSPRRFAGLWAELSSKGELDALLIQDGLGSGKVTPHALTRYLTEFWRIFHSKKVKLWSVVEVFDAVESGEQQFIARSAPLSRIKTQMSVAGPMVDNLVAFSLRYFIPSSEVSGAVQLSEDYQGYIASQ